MVTKAKQTKKIKSVKKPINKVSATVTEEVEEMLDITPAKAKKSVDIEIPDPIIDIDEKVETDLPLDGEAEEDEESLSIDEEDINPFGDKWEM